MREEDYVDGILIHYGEIALKGDNREYFEEKLVDNLRDGHEGLNFERIRQLYGRILVELGKTDSSQLPEYRKRVDRVFGIANYAFVRTCPRDLDTIKEVAWELARGGGFRFVRSCFKAIR